MNWLSENIGTIVVLLIVAATVVTVIINMVKKKKKGGCSCGCSSCPMGQKCPSHKNK
ncbi:MAG: FeoB-associated Cys-rich membrane protein [Clostridia bacterium]|nr:FeoB-associated Cys-rich membrane protein [Clostridia bacterium]